MDENDRYALDSLLNSTSPSPSPSSSESFATPPPEPLPPLNPPPVINCNINFRIGDWNGGRVCREIKGLYAAWNGKPPVIAVNPDDAYETYSVRIRRLLATLNSNPQTTSYEWPSGVILLKPFHTTKQKDFQSLEGQGVDDMCASIQGAWRNEASRFAKNHQDISSVLVQLFVYLSPVTVAGDGEAAGTTGERTAHGRSITHRGTAARFREATAAIQAYNEANPQQADSGPLAFQYLARDYSRNPERIPRDGEELQIPDNPTFHQAQSIDRQRATLIAAGSLPPSAGTKETAFLDVRIEFAVDALREILKLPSLDLRRGIEQLSNNNLQPPEDDMEDVGHSHPDADYHEAERRIDDEERGERDDSYAPLIPEDDEVHDGREHREEEEEEEEEEEVLVRKHHGHRRQRETTVIIDDTHIPPAESAADDSEQEQGLLAEMRTRKRSKISSQPATPTFKTIRRNLRSYSTAAEPPASRTRSKMA